MLFLKTQITIMCKQANHRGAICVFIKKINNDEWFIWIILCFSIRKWLMYNAKLNYLEGKLSASIWCTNGWIFYICRQYFSTHRDGYGNPGKVVKSMRSCSIWTSVFVRKWRKNKRRNYYWIICGIIWGKITTSQFARTKSEIELYILTSNTDITTGGHIDITYARFCLF